MTWHTKHGMRVWVYGEILLQGNRARAAPENAVSVPAWRKASKAVKKLLPEGWDIIKQPDYLKLRCFDNVHFGNMTDEKLGIIIATIRIAGVLVHRNWS